jgi:hypothetical protein
MNNVKEAIDANQKNAPYGCQCAGYYHTWKWINKITATSLEPVSVLDM